MKRILSALIVLTLLLSAVVTVSAEESSVPDLERPVEPTVSAIPDSHPQWKNLSNVSVTFYILAGKADIFYTVSSSSADISVKAELYKNGLFPKNITEKEFSSVNRKFVSGSLTAPITEDGTYTVKITVKSGKDKAVITKEYQYRAADYIGDVNYNGQIQADDARRILRFSAKLDKLTNDMKNVCDADRNGNVSAADARIVLRRAARI